MKTTLNLPDALLAAVKQRARYEGRSQTSVIEEALWRLLNDTASATDRAMPTFGEQGNNALLINLEDKEAVYEAFDAGSDHSDAA